MNGPFDPTRRPGAGTAVSAASVVLAGAITLAGCSTADGLLEATGLAAYTTQSATLIVLHSAGVGVQLAPVCAEHGTGPVTCTEGKTTAGATITVTGPDPKVDQSSQITVSVAGKVIFQGSAVEQMRKAGQVDR